MDFRKCFWEIYWMNMTIFTLGLFCVKHPGEGSRFNLFKYYENYKSYVNEFLQLLILQDIRSYSKKRIAYWNQVPSLIHG